MKQINQQTKTVGLFSEDTSIHYVDNDLVITTTQTGPQVVLRNGSKHSLNYALKLSNFILKKGGSWLKRHDGLSYHYLEPSLGR
jgi:hypothetical protein